jgi:hypothetical protein
MNDGAIITRILATSRVTGWHFTDKRGSAMWLVAARRSQHGAMAKAYYLPIHAEATLTLR